VSRLSRFESNNYGSSTSNAVNEHSSLLFSHLDKVLSVRSVGTVADDYRYEPPHIAVSKKSSFTQSIFNSINILIGIGILALPLGFKVSVLFYLIIERIVQV
jgi:hypothetical protein